MVSLAAAKPLLGDIEYGEAVDEVLEGADAVVLITEWNEFRALDPERMKALLATPLVIDLRNVYSPSEMVAAGFDYVGVGRPTVGGSSDV